jgi:acyl carrier protein
MTTSAAALSADHVLGVVRDAVALVLEVDPAVVRPDTELAALEADSLALVEIAEIVEEQLQPLVPGSFRIPDQDLEALCTVGDAVDYLLARL